MSKTQKIEVLSQSVSFFKYRDEDYISLTDMLKAKDGAFFISDWLRNRNIVEYLGIWERIHNPAFNYGEFAIIKSHPENKGNIRDYGMFLNWFAA